MSSTKATFLRGRTCTAITPADSDLAKAADAIYCAGAGTIIITDDLDNVTTITMVAGGIWPCVVKRVAAASDATGIVALYE